MNTLSIYNDENEATIAVTLSTSSSTFFLYLDSPSFEVFVHAQIIQSRHSGRSITIAINDTVFEGTDITKGPNAPIIGCFGPGFISTRDPKRVINFGVIRPHYSQTNDYKSSLFEGRFYFLMVPGSGEEVIVTRKLSLGQIFKSPGLQHREILQGEIFKLRMSPGGLQPQWWRWGDLGGDLNGKILHAWGKGGNYVNNSD